MASQITSLTIVYSAVYSGTDQRKHQSSAPLAFVTRIHRCSANSPYKGPVTRKCFHFMTSSWDLRRGTYCCSSSPTRNPTGGGTCHSSSPIARFMGPIWGPSGADKTQVGPMLAPWILLSGMSCKKSLVGNHISIFSYSPVGQEWVVSHPQVTQEWVVSHSQITSTLIV